MLFYFIQRNLKPILFPIFAMSALLFVVFGLVYLGYKGFQGAHLSQVQQWSIWDGVVILLSCIIPFTVFRMFNMTLSYVRWRLLAFLRPDWALIVSLCYSFLAIREKSLWRDQAHRNYIAVHLAVAADAIEKFMPRYAFRSDLTSTSVVRQRFKEAAMPLRQKIVWLATPGPLTRTDLEAELREAILVASLGELDQLERSADPTQAVQAQPRNWWGSLRDLCHGAAWALTPLALVQLGSALQLPLLSEPTEQTAAQKAAYIWLALAILRGLSPGNFKETIEAAGTLLGRSKAKGAE